jgi:hypothetical protein
MIKKRVRLTAEEKLNMKLKKSSSDDFKGALERKELSDFPSEELMSIVTAFRAFKKHGSTELKKYYPDYEGIVLKYSEMELTAFIEQAKGLVKE